MSELTWCAMCATWGDHGSGNCPELAHIQASGHACLEGHWVKWDRWQMSFGAVLGVDFVAEEKPPRPSATKEAAKLPRRTQERPTVSLEVKGLANALALEFYRGEYRERYKHQKWLTHDAGPMLTVNTPAAARYAEEQAHNATGVFWRSWIPDAKELWAKIQKEAS